MKLSWRSIRRGVLGSVCLSALALLGVVLLPARQDLLRAWRQIAPGALLAGGLFVAAVWASKAGRMWIIARAMGARVGFPRFLAIYLAACFASHITPFSAGGVPMQVYLAHREGLTVGAATALTAVDLGLNSLVFLVAVPSALLLGQGGLTFHVPGWLGWVAGFLGAFILAGLVWRRWRRPARPGGSPPARPARSYGIPRLAGEPDRATREASAALPAPALLALCCFSVRAAARNQSQRAGGKRIRGPVIP